MMTCKYGIISDYAGCTYEELLDLRAKVMDDIIAFEEKKTIEDSAIAGYLASLRF